MEVWQVKLKALSGGLTRIVDAYDSFSFTKRVNSAGAFALNYAKRCDETLDAFTARCGEWVLDGQVEFWQRDDALGIDWRKDFEGLVRWQRWYVTADGTLKFEVGGRGYKDLLARRIIASASGTAHARWVAQPAETIMKDIVTYQVGASAGAGRVTTGLSVEADGGNGNTLTLQRAYKPVLDVLQEIVSIGGGDFDIVGTGAATFEFRWYTGQLGTDRTATVIFALERGNMAEPSLTIGRQDEVNAVLVGGQGEGAARATVWRTDAARIALSTWNRCEAFRDARDESTTAGLNAHGDAELEAGTPRAKLDFKILQTPGCAYGLHYFLGDLVTARFLDYEGTKKIVAVTVTVDESGSSKTMEMEDV